MSINLINYQIKNEKSLKIKLRLNINSNKVLPKVNLALTPLGINASLLLTQFCLLNPLLYDENMFVNIVLEELDDDVFLEGSINYLEWKNLLFCERPEGPKTSIDDEFSLFTGKLDLLTFLIFIKVCEKIFINFSNNLIYCNNQSTNEYTITNFVKFQEYKVALRKPSPLFTSDQVYIIFDQIQFIIKNNRKSTYFNHVLNRNNYISFNKTVFYFNISCTYLYKLFRMYKYIILNHHD